MSDISKDKIILDCADAYRTASGTTEKVKAGELAEKIVGLSRSVSSGVHYYRSTTRMAPGRSYLITDGASGSTSVSVLKCGDNGELTAIKASVDSTGNILKFDEDLNCEWMCMPGNPEGTNAEYRAPATYMFQNKKTGGWLYNPVYEKGNGTDMAVTDDPLTDEYSPFTRQIFNSDSAYYSYFRKKNHGGYAQYNPSEPSWVKFGTNGYSQNDAALNDPNVAFNLAGQTGFSDLVLTYYTANTNGGNLDIFAQADGDYIETKMGSGLTPDWRSFVLSDNTSVSLKDKLLHMFRMDVDLAGGYGYLSSAILYRNIYARISGQAYAKNAAKYGPSLMYPSHRYPFCQFATPLVSGSKITKVSNFDSANNSAAYPEQYSYGWRDGKFVRSWNNANITAFQLWERVDEAGDTYEYVPVTSEDEIINGEIYFISNSEKLEGSSVWRGDTQEVFIIPAPTANFNYEDSSWAVHKIGDYFHLSSRSNGFNLCSTKNGKLNYMRNSLSIGEIGPYFRWKYDFANHRLIGYTNLQNAGEPLKSVSVGFDGTSGDIYLLRRKSKYTAIDPTAAVIQEVEES